MFLKSVLGKGQSGAPAKRLITFDRVVYPVLTPKELLSTKELTQAIDSIAQRADLPGDHYQALYLDLIHDFANFVQILPKGNRESIASALNEGIQRALYALKTHKEKSEDPHNHLQTYVIFSAALLFEVGRVVDDRKVVICDAEGRFIEHWAAFKGPINQTGQHYKVREMPDMPAQYAQTITPLLARQLMPSAGFEWIAEQPKMLDAWLAMLVGKEPTTRGFVYILEVIKEWHTMNLEGQRFFFPPPAFDTLEPNETMAGEAFLAWLKQSIADGTLTINQADSMVHMTKAGLLIEAPMLFEVFAKENAKYATHWTVVQQQFNALGLTTPGADGGIQYDQFHAKSPEAQHAKRIAGAQAGVFGPQHPAGPAAGSLAQRYQAAQAKQAQVGKQTIKEGMLLRNAEFVFGNSPLPTINPLLKAVVADAALVRRLPNIRASAQNTLPPLFTPTPAPDPSSAAGGQ